jgi:hypothetical protein
VIVSPALSAANPSRPDTIFSASRFARAIRESVTP